METLVKHLGRCSLVVLVLLVLLPSVAAQGAELSGWLDSLLELQLEPASLSLSTDLSLELDLSDSLTSYIYLHAAEAGLERISWKQIYYLSKALRFTTSVKFSDGAFSKAELYLRYRNSPWEVDAKGYLEAEEGPSGEIYLGYLPDDLPNYELTLYLSGEAPSVTAASLTAALPPIKGWKLKLFPHWKLEEGLLPWNWQIAKPFPGGKFQFQGRGTSLTEAIWTRKTGGDKHWALQADWDLEANTLNLEDTLYLDKGEESGYGLKLTSTGLVPFSISRTTAYVFGPGWKCTLTVPDQTIRFQSQLKITKQLDLFADLTLSPSGIEGDLGTDLYRGSTTMTTGFYLEESIIQELYWEAYFEF